MQNVRENKYRLDWEKFTKRSDRRISYMLQGTNYGVCEINYLGMGSFFLKLTFQFNKFNILSFLFNE